MEACAPALIELAGRLADAGGAVARRYFRGTLAVDTKADESPVTLADREAEAAMRALLAEAVPEHGVVGEEHGTERGDAEFVWVLDPIDGTKAFITGNPLFGCLVSLTRRGRPILGVIDMPALGERWIGAAGHPTLHRAAEGTAQPVRVRPCAGLDQAILRCTSPAMFPEGSAEAGAFARLRGAARLTLYGGDCFCYAQVASGWADLAVEAGLQPYDFLALLPVIEGAGGVACDWNGEPLRLGSDGRVVFAGDPRVRDAALERLRGG